MLAVFSPIFVADTKITFVYNFVAPLSYHAPQLWTLLSEEIKQRNTANLFKSDVEQWICKECPCRLCKVLVPKPRIYLTCGSYLQ